MDHVKATLQRTIHLVNKHKKIAVGAGLILALLLYLLIFMVPKSVAFSYGGATCTRQLTLFPAVHKTVNVDRFDTHFDGGVSLGSFHVVSTSTCFTAVREPQPGTSRVATAPLGGLFAQKQFALVVPEAPLATAMQTRAVPVTKYLDVPLTGKDAVFRYSLEASKGSASCNASEVGVRCDLPALQLDQGEEYTLTLNRQFKNEAKKSVTDMKITTLKAVTVKKASIKNGQTVYSKPTSFTFQTDKELVGAKATLVTDDKNKKTIETSIAVSDKTITLKLAKQLERTKAYKLRLTSIEAVDGSTLVEPVKYDFMMSGGPKVTAVNIGRSGVSSSAAVVLQFDQEIGSTKEVVKYISMSGGSYTVQAGTRSVTVQLQGLGRCQGFTINLKKGIPSKYDINSADDWSYASRTVCHQTIQYGTSLGGRPLLAYVFGTSGPMTMYAGAIHGNEASSSGLMRAWVDELEANAGRLKGKRVVVIPTINPDGVAAGTRTNARGVNLSRNFPTDNWTSDIDDTDGKHKGGGGKKPLSEPESSALASITRQYRPRLLLSFHAIGSLVVGDPGGYSAGYAARYASMVGYRNATGSSGTFDYSITGSYEDWTYRNEGIPSLVIELGSYGYYSISHHKAALWAML